MFKMTAFGVDTGSQTTLPLINGVIHNALFQSTPHGDNKSRLLQFLSETRQLIARPHTFLIPTIF